MWTYIFFYIFVTQLLCLLIDFEGSEVNVNFIEIDLLTDFCTKKKQKQLVDHTIFF